MIFLKNKFFLILIFIGTVVSFIFLAKIKTDYGWIALNIDNFIQTNIFLNVVMNNEISFGAVYLYLDSQISSFIGFNYVSVFMIEFFIMGVGFWYLYLFIFDKTSNMLLTHVSLLLFILYALTTNIFLGPRAESIYISFLIIMIYYVDKLLSVKVFRNTIYFQLAFIAILASISHPNGLLLSLFFGFVLIYSIWKKYISLLFSVSLMLLVSFFTYHGLLLGREFDLVFRDFLNVAMDSNHTRPFYTEYKRYISFFINFPYLLPFYILSIIGFIGFTFSTFKKKQMYLKISYESSLVIIISFILINIYLILIGQKHYYYLSLYFFYWTLGFVYAIYMIGNVYRSKDFLNTIYILLLVIIFNQGIDNFKKHSIIHVAMNLDFKKILKLKNIAYQIQKKNIIAPVQLYFFLKKNNILKFQPSNRISKNNIDIEDYDYVIENIYTSKVDTSNFVFVDTFEYFGYKYNIFKVNKN